MRKLVIISLVLVLCSGAGLLYAGKYTHLKPTIKGIVDTVVVFIQEMEKASDARSVAAAINKYADATIKMAPKVRKMMTDYPELEDESNRPEELKPLMDKFDKLMPKMMGLMAKMGQYQDDPAVQAAGEKLEKAMKAMDPKQEEEEETEE